VLPVLGREVVEGEQRVAILDQALDRLLLEITGAQPLVLAACPVSRPHREVRSRRYAMLASRLRRRYTARFDRGGRVSRA
jgi:hypothetical protein